MPMPKSFNDDAINRISDAVKRSEEAERGNGYGRRVGRPAPQGFLFGIAKQDGDRGDTIAVSILASIKNPEGDEVREAKAYVWACPVEEGDELILAGVTGTLTIASLYREG